MKESYWLWFNGFTESWYKLSVPTFCHDMHQSLYQVPIYCMLSLLSIMSLNMALMLTPASRILLIPIPRMSSNKPGPLCGCLIGKFHAVASIMSRLFPRIVSSFLVNYLWFVGSEIDQILSFLIYYWHWFSVNPCYALRLLL